MVGAGEGQNDHRVDAVWISLAELDRTAVAGDELTNDRQAETASPDSGVRTLPEAVERPLTVVLGHPGDHYRASSTALESAGW